MKKIEAYLTFDDKIFRTEHEAEEYEKFFIEKVKETTLIIQKICQNHNCSFCPLSVNTSTDIHCPFNDIDDSFCAPDDWTLKFSAE